MSLAVILIAGGSLLSCGKGDEPTPTPTPTEAPTITVLVSNYNVDIFGGSTLTISGTKLLLDGEEVASWTDKNTATCKVTVQCNGKDVASGAKLSEQGKLVITVTNENGKSTQATVTLTSDTIM